jgi:Protein of unknown function (DUF3800)
VSVPLPRAFGGAPLEGRKLMRFAFIDEGGISRREPFVVVAGVFVHGDEQLVPLEEKIWGLVRKHIPKDDQEGFVFHAMDIWSGSRYFKDEKQWPLQKRLNILRDMARLPRKLNIPIVYEAIERAKVKFTEAPREPTIKEHSTGIHTLTFAACTLRIEQHMRELWPDEVVKMIAEDNDQVRAFLKEVHEILRYPSRAQGRLVPNRILPLRKIRGSVHYANKKEEVALQLADLCAFLIRGHFSQHPQNRPLYERIQPMLLRQPPGEIYSGPLITAAPPYVAVQFF